MCLPEQWLHTMYLRPSYFSALVMIPHVAKQLQLGLVVG